MEYQNGKSLNYSHRHNDDMSHTKDKKLQNLEIFYIIP